ncbi:MAG: glycosyltransferase family 2 protein [Candidatus Manganitrophaceae bacterium]
MKNRDCRVASLLAMTTLGTFHETIKSGSMIFRTRKSISVIFPAYNEEENIAKAVEQAVHCLDSLFRGWEVIVVNDGSRDRTGEVIDLLARSDLRIKAVHHPVNRGYGAALRSGIKEARKELIFFCDSDLQFHLNELLLLITWIEQYDVVVGYRANRRDPFYRKLNAFGWNLMVRLLLGLKVKDIDCAFKLFRNSVFRTIRIDAVGAMVNTDILVQATRMGFRIKEVPVTHFPRLSGKQTGADLKVIFRAFRELFRLCFKLRNVKPVLISHDRREGTHKEGFPQTVRRGGDRRKVSLPINFLDRRVKIFLSNEEGSGIGAYSQIPDGEREHA